MGPHSRAVRCVRTLMKLPCNAIDMTTADTETYVLLELAKTVYAIPSANVQHIEMLEHVTLVPNAHRAIDGVVFSRGQVIPALNLRVRFGFPRQDRDMRTRVIFAQTH